MAFFVHNAASQKDAIPLIIPLTLNQYITNVTQGNMGLIAERFNVLISEAGLKSAKVFADPEISVSYSNNQDQVLHMGQGIETSISYPVSLGNKREANIKYSRSQTELSRLYLEEFFNNLRADASLSYFNALKSYKLFDLQQDTYRQIAELAQSDSLRLTLGEASEIDAMQSALEAKIQKNRVYESQAELQNAMAELTQWQGKAVGDTMFTPGGEFPVAARIYLLPQLIDNALKNKGNVKIALQNKDVSEKYLRLIKAGRAPEFSLEAAYSINSEARNEIAPAPPYRCISSGITVPLKLSNLNKGALSAAELTYRQNDANIKLAEQQVITLVTQAYNTFMAENKKIEQFSSGLTHQAEKILKGRIYSYKRGETGLTEVLNAQRSFTGLRIEYLETQFSYVTALIELQRASGFWDLSIGN
jgi:outer membrane protein, heavy metal efflux system